MDELCPDVANGEMLDIMAVRMIHALKGMELGRFCTDHKESIQEFFQDTKRRREFGWQLARGCGLSDMLIIQGMFGVQWTREDLLSRDPEGVRMVDRAYWRKSIAYRMLNLELLCQSELVGVWRRGILNLTLQDWLMKSPLCQEEKDWNERNLLGWNNRDRNQPNEVSLFDRVRKTHLKDTLRIIGRDGGVKKMEEVWRKLDKGERDALSVERKDKILSGRDAFNSLVKTVKTRGQQQRLFPFLLSGKEARTAFRVIGGEVRP